MIEWPTVHYKEGEHPWVSYFRQQTLRKNNCINAVCTGMPGKGKSWGLIKLLSDSDPTFNQDRIYFKASDMLRWVKDGGLNEQKPTAFMLDEAGIDASNMKWWDEVNRALNAFFQTSRSSNYIFGMTVPFVTLISKGVRNLMNVRFYADGYRENYTIFKRGFTLEYNDDMDKVYRKKLYVKRPGGGAFCQGLKLARADEKLLKKYEERKEEFKLKIYSDIEKKLEVHERREKDKLKDTSLLSVPQQNYYDLRWSGKSTKEVCEILGVSTRSGYIMEERIRKRGKNMPEESIKKAKVDKILSDRGTVEV